MLLNSIIVVNSAKNKVQNDFLSTDQAFRDSLGNSLSIAGQIEDEVKILDELDIPVYVIHGKQDSVVSLDYIKSLKSIQRIYEIDNCGHYPHIEQSEKFNEIISIISDEIFFQQSI